MNASAVKRCVVPSLNRFQSTPRIKRRTGSRRAVFDQSCGGFQPAIFSLRNLSIKTFARCGFSSSGNSSPSRTGRPVTPPNPARKSADRLPSTTGTLIPPEIASHARHPSAGDSIENSSPPRTKAGCPAARYVELMRALKSPPHQTTIRSSANRSRKPPKVTSRPAADSSLPASKFATRNACVSSAPPNETPNSRKPVRPKSCTLVKKPARIAVAFTLSIFRILHG